MIFVRGRTLRLWLYCRERIFDSEMLHLDRSFEGGEFGLGEAPNNIQTGRQGTSYSNKMVNSRDGVGTGEQI